MVGNSRVFEGANPFSLPAAWKVGSELGGIKGEVKESKKKPTRVGYSCWAVARE